MIDADERWVTGDHFGLSIPVDPAALRAGGTAFLTRAPLQMLTNALSLWETRHFGDLLDAMLA